MISFLRVGVVFGHYSVDMYNTNLVWFNIKHVCLFACYFILSLSIFFFQDLTKFYMGISKLYDPVEENEEKVVSVDASLSKADVLKKIKDVCKEHFSKKQFDNSYIESNLSKLLTSS